MLLVNQRRLCGSDSKHGDSGESRRPLSERNWLCRRWKVERAPDLVDASPAGDEAENEQQHGERCEAAERGEEGQ